MIVALESLDADITVTVNASWEGRCERWPLLGRAVADRATVVANKSKEKRGAVLTWT